MRFIILCLASLGSTPALACGLMLDPSFDDAHLVRELDDAFGVIDGELLADLAPDAPEPAVAYPGTIGAVGPSERRPAIRALLLPTPPVSPELPSIPAS